MRIAINGFGRIGRQVLRALEGHDPPAQRLVVDLGGARARLTVEPRDGDDAAQGARDIRQAGVLKRDVVVGLTASGSTPYVLGALFCAIPVFIDLVLPGNRLLQGLSVSGNVSAGGQNGSFEAESATNTNAKLAAGGTVTHGSATIKNTGPGRQRITQTSDKAVINWDSFSIGPDGRVRFVQPAADSVVLNRVTGSEPSSIFGSIRANGQVFLVNPFGIYFSPTATLDVGGLLASTLNIRDPDFLAGRYHFMRDPASPAGAAVVNEGRITAQPGGYVVLAGDYAANKGLIEAHGGNVALASGSQVTLDFQGDGHREGPLGCFDQSEPITDSVDRPVEERYGVRGGPVFGQPGVVEDKELLDCRAARVHQYEAREDRLRRVRRRVL